MQKKSQISFEFVSTYAWVLISIVVVVSGLFYFNVFDFSKYSPTKCYMGPQIRCDDYLLDYNKNPKRPKLMLRMTNNFGSTIKLTDIKIESNLPFDFKINQIKINGLNMNSFVWTDGTTAEFVLTGKPVSGGGQHPILQVLNKKIKLNLVLTYYDTVTGSSVQHELRGYVFTIVQEDTT